MNKKDVSKQVQALINKASVKQKALLVAMGRIDKENSGKDPTLTEEDVKAIKDSLREDQDRRKYNKWMGIYNTYAEIMPLFGLAYREYQATAERLLGALTLWESYTREEEHLMLICKALKEKGEDVTKELAKTLSSLKFSLAKLRVTEDGRPEIDASALYDVFILPYVEDVKSTYRTAKAMVIVTEEFTARTHSEEFRPGLMIKSIEKVTLNFDDMFVKIE